MKKALLRFLLPVGFLLLLSGCWSAKEANEIDYVMGVGIDKTDSGEIILTIQTPDLSAIKLENASGEDKFKTISVKGATTFEALRNYINVVGQKLFWGHIQVCIIGEKAAREGVDDFLDFFSADAELRGTSYIAVVKGLAKDLMESRLTLMPIPSEYLSNLMSNANLNGKAPKVQLVDFNRMLTEPTGSQPYAPVMELMSQEVYDRRIFGRQISSSKGDEQTPIIYTGGTAVFRGNKLKGFLSEKESRGLIWTKNSMKSAIISVQADEGGVISLELIGGVKNRRKVWMENGQAHIRVDISANLNIGDRSGYKNVVKTEELAELEKGFNDIVRKEVEMAFDKTVRKLHCDIFSFGNSLNDRNPKEWEKVKERWEDEILPAAKLDIRVHGTIRRTTRTLYSPWVENGK
ncbi:Ger(x)C family spore germination protein [Paenibacillus sp. YN15]|uniref:Ger(x)C family spore germination protein n=1 Tax=Paenibacillus sp. YN15 TaxID=1742774 RepID=UPI000DCEAE16|nr:Ger(x)C family spore germination protein [Paenibacillus sp. YN15]RAV01006.1 hypothetical protein DQG13_13515 [Paenibacillus sp. YN15]